MYPEVSQNDNQKNERKKDERKKIFKAELLKAVERGIEGNGEDVSPKKSSLRKK